MTEPTTTKPILLVVDDSRLMRVAARKILKTEFEIVDAEDGEIAWDMLQGNADIALVMSDLSMPNLDGLGLLKKIRESDRAHLRELPVIIVTGAEDDDGSKATAFAAGASDFITKPFESVQLLARTKAQARQQQMQQALQNSEASKTQLKEQSSLDPLTRLLNRQSFMNSVEEQLAYALRHRTELSMLVLRIDKYRVMFLRRGKQEAEGVLCQVASTVKQRKRREDIVARIGIDTLAVLLPSSNSIGCAKVAEGLLNAIAQQQSDSAEAPRVNVSFGTSSLSIQRNLKATEFVDDALKALDEPKNSAAASPQTPDTPATPAPTVNVEPPVASIEEVFRALQALAAGSVPAQSADQLARAIMPVLELWNKSAEDRYRTLLDSLASALDTREDSSDPPAHLPESSIHSI